MTNYPRLIRSQYDAGTAWPTQWGVGNAPVTSADMSGAATNVTESPESGKKLVIDDILVSSDTALKFTFTEQTTGYVVAHIRVPANGTMQLTFRGRRRLSTADKKLFCQTSAAGNVEILVGHHSE